MHVFLGVVQFGVLGINSMEIKIYIYIIYIYYFLLATHSLGRDIELVGVGQASEAAQRGVAGTKVILEQLMDGVPTPADGRLVVIAVDLCSNRRGLQGS